MTQDDYSSSPHLVQFDGAMSHAVTSNRRALPNSHIMSLALRGACKLVFLGLTDVWLQCRSHPSYNPFHLYPRGSTLNCHKAHWRLLFTHHRPNFADEEQHTAGLWFACLFATFIDAVEIHLSRLCHVGSFGRGHKLDADTLTNFAACDDSGLHQGTTW